MRVQEQITVFAPDGAEPDERALAQLVEVMSDERAVAGALMADHHLGYSMPIGGVVAYEGAVSPSGVGFDIACGNKAVRTGLRVEEIADELPRLLDEIESTVAFGIGRSNPVPADDGFMDGHASVLAELDRLAGARQALSQKARAQLGTVGAGNHYVDLLADEDDRVWVANHFGSRGLGHTIATGFLNLAAGEEFGARVQEREQATVIDTETELGQFYIAAMTLAGDYAYAGRDAVVDQVCKILGTSFSLAVHNHHNFAWLEDGRWVVRKGATPLTGEMAFIGGSMGEGAMIVRGSKNVSLGEFMQQGGSLDSSGVLDVGALGSAPHGAGRLMSRTKAAGKVKRRTRYGCPDRDCPYEISPQQFEEQKRANPSREPFCATHSLGLRRFQKLEQRTKGIVDWEAVQADLAERGIVLRGSGPDEAPEVYKSLAGVIAAHPNIEIVSRLRPLGVVMAGADVFDPYKD